jgi:hypothetical protein
MEEILLNVPKVDVKLLKPMSLVKETLSRIGIANRDKKVLYQSCYVFENEGKTSIAHFKELLRVPRLTESDLKRRNTIIWLLHKWGLVELIDKSLTESVFSNIQQKQIFILKKEQKDAENWTIEGKWHNRENTKENS